jgi:hypothetical protein
MKGKWILKEVYFEGGLKKTGSVWVPKQPVRSTFVDRLAFLDYGGEELEQLYRKVHSRREAGDEKMEFGLHRDAIRKALESIVYIRSAADLIGYSRLGKELLELHHQARRLGIYVDVPILRFQRGLEYREAAKQMVAEIEEQLREGDGKAMDKTYIAERLVGIAKGLAGVTERQSSRPRSAKSYSGWYKSSGGILGTIVAWCAAGGNDDAEMMSDLHDLYLPGAKSKLMDILRRADIDVSDAGTEISKVASYSNRIYGLVLLPLGSSVTEEQMARTGLKEGRP